MVNSGVWRNFFKFRNVVIQPALYTYGTPSGLQEESGFCGLSWFHGEKYLTVLIRLYVYF
jgi:hypothetical protein